MSWHHSPHQHDRFVIVTTTDGPIWARHRAMERVGHGNAAQKAMAATGVGIREWASPIPMAAMMPDQQAAGSSRS
jgi:hypothetical protein